MTDTRRVPPTMPVLFARFRDAAAGLFAKLIPGIVRTRAVFELFYTLRLAFLGLEFVFSSDGPFPIQKFAFEDLIAVRGVSARDDGKVIHLRDGFRLRVNLAAEQPIQPTPKQRVFIRWNGF